MENKNALREHNGMENIKEPYVKILVQPSNTRFRYKCEGSHGRILGATSTAENKTYVTIKVVGLVAKAKVVVSCVTEDFKSHPHRLFGYDKGQKYGVCVVEIDSPDMSFQFDNLGIQCVKMREIKDELCLRKEKNLDPFRQGFDHCEEFNQRDLKSVRLCFQVFLQDASGSFCVPLKPVASDVIHDIRDRNLNIYDMSDCSCSVNGGKKIILLCGNINPKDIQVRFFEEKNGTVCWEKLVDIPSTLVHRKAAISFLSPAYQYLRVKNPVKAHIQLRRPSDGETGKPHEFLFIPDEDFSRKKIKMPDPALVSHFYASYVSGIRESAEISQGYPQPLQHSTYPQNFQTGSAGPTFQRSIHGEETESLREPPAISQGHPQPVQHFTYSQHSQIASAGPLFQSPIHETECIREPPAISQGHPQPVQHFTYSQHSQIASAGPSFQRPIHETECIREPPAIFQRHPQPLQNFTYGQNYQKESAGSSIQESTGKDLRQASYSSTTIPSQPFQSTVNTQAKTYAQMDSAFHEDSSNKIDDTIMDGDWDIRQWASEKSRNENAINTSQDLSKNDLSSKNIETSIEHVMRHSAAPNSFSPNISVDTNLQNPASVETNIVQLGVTQPSDPGNMNIVNECDCADYCAHSTVSYSDTIKYLRSNCRLESVENLSSELKQLSMI